MLFPFNSLILYLSAGLKCRTEPKEASLIAMLIPFYELDCASPSSEYSRHISEGGDKTVVLAP